MRHDVLTRAYLRQYAFLVRSRPGVSSRTAFHFSTLAVSGLMSLAALAILAIALWILSRVLGRPVVLWSAPDWVVAIIAAGIAFLPGMYIDRKMEIFRVVGSDLIDFYSTRRQRQLWLLTILSIIPLGVVTGLCFAAMRVGT